MLVDNSVFTSKTLEQVFEKKAADHAKFGFVSAAYLKAFKRMDYEEVKDHISQKDYDRFIAKYEAGKLHSNPKLEYMYIEIQNA